MSEFSIGVNLVWQMAAAEAAAVRHQYIEKEHLFNGLCKAGDLLVSPEFKQGEIKLEEITVDNACISHSCH